MKPISRTWTAVIVVAVVATAAAVFLYLRKGPPTAPGGPLPELVTLAPRDARTIIYADVQAFRSSEFFSRLMALLPAPHQDTDYADFERATGFDYSRDLDRVMVAWRSAPTTASPAKPIQESRTFAIAEGRFDKEKISHFALAPAPGKSAPRATVEKQNGVDVYIVQSTDPPPSEAEKNPRARPSSPRTIAFAFVTENRLVIAEGSDLSFALAPEKDNPAPDPASQATFRTQAARVAGAPFFVVGRNDSFADNSSRSSEWFFSQIASVIQSVRWYSVAARPEGDRLRVSLLGECDDSWKARQLAVLLEGVRLLARTALKDEQTRRRISPEQLAALEQIVQNATIEREDNRVELRFELTPSMLGPAHPEPPPAQQHKGI